MRKVEYDNQGNAGCPDCGNRNLLHNCVTKKFVCNQCGWYGMGELKKAPMSVISQYNLAHTELGVSCCGVFTVIDDHGLIHCNECNSTLHESIITALQKPGA